MGYAQCSHHIERLETLVLHYSKHFTCSDVVLESLLLTLSRFQIFFKSSLSIVDFEQINVCIQGLRRLMTRKFLKICHISAIIIGVTDTFAITATAIAITITITTAVTMTTWPR